MRRLQLFEFEDQPWLPRQLRDHLTEYLQYQITAYRLYAPVVGKLKQALEAAGCRQIVDIGSGGGGTILHMQRMLRLAGCPVSVTLTDKFPPRDVVARLQALGAGTIAYRPESIDATRIPPDLAGLRTFFTCFHHFPPAAATRILRSAVEDRAPIGIFEFTGRSVANIAGMLLAPAAVLAQARKLAPRRRDRLFWTYILPALPLIYWWDGTVSHLRTYTVAELRKMVAAVDSGRYAWEIGQLRSSDASEPVTYLIGLPRGG
jgi:hypothetical protein